MKMKRIQKYRYSDANTHTDNLTLAEAQKFVKLQNGGTVAPMPSAKGKRILSVTIKRITDESPDTSYLGEYSNRSTSEFSIDRAHSEGCNLNNPQREEYGAKLDRIGNYVETLAQEECDRFGETPEFESLNEAYDELQQIADDWDDCDCNERGDMQRNEYHYFNPSFNYVDKNGHALPENTPEEVRKYVRQDYERMESLNAGNWCYIGVRVDAELAIENRTSTNLGDGVPYFDSTVQRITSGGLWGIESDSDKAYLAETEQEQLAELKDQLKALGFSTRAISTAFKTIERTDA